MMTTEQYVRTLVRREVATRNLWQFCLYYDKEFYEARPFLKDVADAFQRVEEGAIKSLSVSMPPRAGKSYLTSLFCAWTLGRNPKDSVMRNTCTATLYVKFSYDVRAIVNSDRFKEVFKDVRLSDDKKNLQGWNTTKAKMVSYFGAGVGGTIIGFGATKVAITDDLYRGLEDALSDTKNDSIKQWKSATHDSRMESGCSRIDIGTRWSTSDVIGEAMEDGDYEQSIVVPALDEMDQSFCEDVMTTDEYLDKRSRMAKEIWLAEYQQQPVDLEGRLFGGMIAITPEDYVRAVTPEPMNAQHQGRETLMDGSFAYIDVADQGNDYMAMIVGAVVGSEIYIVDYLFTRENTDVTIPLAAAMLDKWRVSYCRVESNSMGAMYSRNLQSQTRTKILQVHNTQNKMTRIIMQSAFIINTFKWVQRDTPDCIQFMENMYSFSKEGKNRNDDAPDCAAGLAMFMQSMLRAFRQTSVNQ
jgi:predicted phage terminase large subunit-like protein